MAYDVEMVRRDFPILSRKVHGKPLTYLDNGASAQKPESVLRRIDEMYRAHYANVHRGLHTLSNEATEAYEDARETVKRFLNATTSDEVVFTRSATEGLNIVARGLGKGLKAGDEVIVSLMEHHSNIVPWHFLREEIGIILRFVPVREDGSFDMEAFDAMLSDKVKVVSVTQMSNVLGTVVPVTEVARKAHSVGATVVVDGSQGAVHLPTDVGMLGADFYVMTGHKLYGPTGIGVLWGRLDALRALPPFLGGGEMIVDVSETGVTYAEPPARFEAGTPPIVQAVGLAAALNYMENLGREAIAAHEADLAIYAGERLREINSLTVHGTAQGKGAIWSFALEGTHAHDVSAVLDRYGVAVRAGTHCAQPLLKKLGVTSTCRASFGLYNSREDVDRLVDALRKAQELFA